MRVAGLFEALRSHKLNVIDHGNLAGPPTPWTEPSGGVRHLEEVVAWNRSVFDRVAAVLAAGQVPLVMGGDLLWHDTVWQSAAADARQPRMSKSSTEMMGLPTPNPKGPPVSRSTSVQDHPGRPVEDPIGPGRDQTRRGPHDLAHREGLRGRVDSRRMARAQGQGRLRTGRLVSRPAGPRNVRKGGRRSRAGRQASVRERPPSRGASVSPAWKMSR